ncbi:MAG TPA: glycerophosphodiester phosphodiesterase family protein [Haloplasmataceae bacterium]
MSKPIEISLIGDTEIIAHRGLSGLAPENTKEAFILAGEHGYYGTECDIHFTKDKKMVVFHDHSLERMTGRKLLIKELFSDDIKQLMINSGNGIMHYKNVQIPFLEEYLDICIKYNMVPIIEVKSVHELQDLDFLIDLLKEKALLDVSHIISFHLEFLIYLRDKVRDLIIYYLVDSIKENDINICKTYGFNIDANGKYLTKDHIINCHKHQIKVNTYTVDDVQLAKTFNEAQIDYITSNILKKRVE